MKLYELRLDGGEVYYSLGVFESPVDIARAVAEYDGPSVSGSGGPLTEFGDDGESGVVVELDLGYLYLDLGYMYRDCYGTGGVILTMERDWRAPDPECTDDDRYDDDDRIWHTKWMAP